MSELATGPDAARRFDATRLDRRDPVLIERVLPALRQLNRAYFRLRVEGTEHLPRGPALLAANHNGGIAGPDLACTTGTLWSHYGAHAPLYMLAHDFAMRQLTPLGAVVQRFGGLRASRENARAALDAGARVLVYPGGDLDAYRHFRRRDEVVLGSRTGFVTVAREAGVPIVPVVAHGAHRSAVILTEGAELARFMGLRRWGRLERFPIALALPWGIAPGPWIPYLPLPFRIQLRFLEPVEVPREADPVEVQRSIAARMQRALDELAARARRGR